MDEETRREFERIERRLEEGESKFHRLEAAITSLANRIGGTDPEKPGVAMRIDRIEQSFKTWGAFVAVLVVIGNIVQTVISLVMFFYRP